MKNNESTQKSIGGVNSKVETKDPNTNSNPNTTIKIYLF